MKKAEGLSLSTIVIAAIVLVVLIVLWAIFTGRMGKFTSDLTQQENKECVKDLGGTLQEPPCAAGKIPIKTTDATAIGTMVCCK